MVRISGGLLARNTLINLIGQGLPLLVAVVAIPIIVRGMGMDRFGLLSLVWVFMGSFAIFDLGLGRATTKFVAEALGKGEPEKVPPLVWTAVIVQAIFGIFGGLVLFGITPFLVESILNIPSDLIMEAKTTFYLLAAFVPVILISGSFSGVLEAAQRFDLVNAVRIPSSTLTYLLPMIGMFLGLGLPGIVTLILLAKVAGLAVFIALNLLIIPELKKYSASLTSFPRLFSFGGWIMISNIFGPILYYLDRFLIGALLTMTAVTYYTAPFEMTSRLAIISGSLLMTLFPAFSALGTTRRDNLQRLYIRSIKYLLLIMGPIVLILVIFAGDILRFWLGGDFAQQSTLVFQILLIGALIYLPAPVSLGLFQGLGRPDIAPKIYMIYVPLNIGLVWFFVQSMGITGAALSFALRALFEAALFFIISSKLIHLSYASLKENGLLRGFCAFLALCVPFWGLSLTDTSAIKIGFIVIGAIIFVIVTWNYVLDQIDKDVIISATCKRPLISKVVRRRLHVEK